MVTSIRPQPRTWTREEYHRAAESGLFRPDERLELLEGEVLEKVSPQGDAHASGVLLSAEALRVAFGADFHVREEKPLVLSDASEPEPDVVIVRGSMRQNPRHPTPTTAVLVMEVSDTTLEFDKTEKAAAYARSGIADYWLLNLRRRRLEIHRDPGLTGDDEYGYRSIRIVPAGQEVSPLAAPGAVIRIDDLLPIMTGDMEAGQASGA